jgi:hypothetical protein
MVPCDSNNSTPIEPIQSRLHFPQTTLAGVLGIEWAERNIRYSTGLPNRRTADNIILSKPAHNRFQVVPTFLVHGLVLSSSLR